MVIGNVAAGVGEEGTGVPRLYMGGDQDQSGKERGVLSGEEGLPLSIQR